MTEKLSTEYEQRLLQVKQNYDYIMARIAEAAEKSGRKPEDIKFLAATKTVSYDIINYAISLGLKYIREKIRFRSLIQSMMIISLVIVSFILSDICKQTKLSRLLEK